MSLYFESHSGPLSSLYRHERRGNTPPRSSAIFFTSSMISCGTTSSSTMRSMRVSGSDIFPPPGMVRWMISSSTANASIFMFRPSENNAMLALAEWARKTSTAVMTMRFMGSWLSTS
jgi:hypothetical protein